MYGRGEESIAEQLHCSKEEAAEIKNSVFRNFPAIKQFEEDSIRMAKTKGYVTTLWGRKRRLPNIRLPYYQFEYEDGSKVESMIYSPIIDRLNSFKTRTDKNEYIERLREKEGIVVIQNGGKIAEATRQVINSRIQGSSSDMTKLSMIAIDSNERLNSLKGKLVVTVHDELIIQAPLRYVQEVKPIFKYEMEHAADDRLHMDIKCDVATMFAWGDDEIDLEQELGELYQK